MAHDFRNFIRQLIGKTNLYEYSNTIINQMNLMYWLLGEFYHSKMFNRRVSFFWKLSNVAAIGLLFGHSIVYAFFSADRSVLKLMFTLQVVTVTVNLLITIPIGSYLHRYHILAMFKILDLPSTDTNLEIRPSSIIDRRQNIGGFVARAKMTSRNLNLVLFAQMILFFLYIVCTYLDLFVGYHPGKLADPNYYVYPTYSDNVHNFGVFSILLSSQVFTAFPVGVMFFLVPIFPMNVMREFYLKFQHLSDFVDYRSKLFGYRYEKILQSEQSSGVRKHVILERSLLKDIRECVIQHHILLRGISHTRRYLEFIMSVSLFNFIYIEILVVYIFTTLGEVSVLLKFKMADYAIITAILLFVNCLVADSFADMSEMLENSVYNIPWYYMIPSSRKCVHLLLYQAQTTIEFKALKIHTLGMGFFLASCNSVYSVVNILRGRLANH